MLFTYIIVTRTFSLGDNKSLLSLPPPPPPLPRLNSPYFNNTLEERVKECSLKGELHGKSDEFDELLEGGFMVFRDRNYKIYFVALHKNTTLSFLHDVSNLLELWMVPILIFISSFLQVFLSKFDLFLTRYFSNCSYLYTFLTKKSQSKNNQTLNDLKSSIQLDNSKQKNDDKT